MLKDKVLSNAIAGGRNQMCKKLFIVLALAFSASLLVYTATKHKVVKVFKSVDNSINSILLDSGVDGSVPIETSRLPKPIPPLKFRKEIGMLLEAEGKKTGIELGVQRGHFSKTTLQNWPSCTKYILVDVWAQQENYKDSANRDDAEQENIYRDAMKNVKLWSDKIEAMRMLTVEAAPLIPEDSMDFIYVDARHDYCGTLQDIRDYWPKLKSGGILAGHDFLDNKEIKELGTSDWSLCGDGKTINESAVKGAVLEFAEEHGLTVQVTYGEYPWGSWLMRKP